MSEDLSEMHKRMKKRNRVLGLSLAAFVILVAVFSYFKIKGLTP
ncbi:MULTISPECIES: hypothetical protein [Kordiimonas]|mgnify:FL=1|jgi:uncharacterized membrane protein|uniref:Cytochrome C oxidase assembly protein n=1 Tax=Kordiimonas lacus TaxID=637679 RepID=A0A1G7B5Q2_9PROT|nr:MULTISPECIES: hypothetical protein [Kordiimonas]SDE22177.1 hypothetical protein SAMN04488071_2366 [Kordiimonas lacus]